MRTSSGCVRVGGGGVVAGGKNSTNKTRLAEQRRASSSAVFLGKNPFSNASRGKFRALHNNDLTDPHHTADDRFSEGRGESRVISYSPAVGG